MAHSQFLNRRVRRYLLFFVWVFLLLGMTGSTGWAASWIIYHKPAFAGQILDGETKRPIEGAVVVVQYQKRTIGLGAGTFSSVINIRETLTDKDGRFRIPSYTTAIQPFSWEDRAIFIIFKPWHVSIDYLYDRDLESLFSAGMLENSYLEFEWIYNNSLMIRYRSPNIVELPMAKTREDRLKSLLSPVGESSDWHKQKKLIELIRTEYKDQLSKDPGNLYLYNGGM